MQRTGMGMQRETERVNDFETVAFGIWAWVSSFGFGGLI
jgi:hypothetical protein